jgi:hypothetical protein
MKKSDVFCWLVIGLLLLFLWNSSSIEFFQDTPGIKGPPYTASDATKIVDVMPTTMKAALKTSTRSDDPVRLIQPITPIMSDFHAVYAAATTRLTPSNVDTFLLTETIPTGLTKADVKTLLVTYFVTPTPGAANAPLTAGQIAANAQAAARAAARAASDAAYARQLAALGQTGGYSDASANRLPTSDVSGNGSSTVTTDASANRIPFSSSFGISSGSGSGGGLGGGTPMSGMQLGGPTYGGLGSNANNLATAAGNWASVGSNYPTMYGPSTRGTSLPNSNSGLILPTAEQVGVNMPGCRAPSELGTFTPLETQKMDGDPLGFLPDYRVFMK